MIKPKKWDARLIYFILTGGMALLFTLMFTVSMVYQAQKAGLNPLQLVLVGTMLEVGIFVFEVPTGVVADVYSRRLSIIIGVFMIGVGILLEGAIPAFVTILLAQFIWGIGYTFTSGAIEAWIVDEIGEANIGDIFLRGSQIGGICALVAIPFSVGLATIQLNLPILLAGALFLALGMVMVLYMPETGFKPIPREGRSTWLSMWGTFGDGMRQIRGRPLLLTMAGIGLLYGLYSEGFDRLWTPHLLDDFAMPGLASLPPLIWFGVISAVSTVLGIGATEIVRRRVDAESGGGAARALLLISGAMALLLAVFALAGDFFLAILALFAFNTLRATTYPLFSTWSNRHIDSSVRATVLSMFGQIDAIGQIAGGPPVGLIGVTFGVRAALMTSALILSPVMLLLARAMRLNAAAQPLVASEVSG